MANGYFGIGIFQPKTSENVGTLWRSAYQMGASFIFTIGKRYKKESSDTYATYRHIPLLQFKDWEAFEKSPIYDCQLIGIEFGETSVPLSQFIHPKRAIYLLGAEDNGLSRVATDKCVQLIELQSVRRPSYNVAVAGSLVMYDRMNKGLTDNN